MFRRHAIQPGKVHVHSEHQLNMRYEGEILLSSIRTYQKSLCSLHCATNYTQIELFKAFIIAQSQDHHKGR